MKGRRFFLSGLAVLAIVGYVNDDALDRLVHDSAEVGHAHDVMATLASLDGELAKASSSRRGFVLSQDSGFVRQFEAANARFDELCGRLAALLGGSDRDRARVQRLTQLGRRRLDTLRTLMDAGSGAGGPIREQLARDPLPRAIRAELLLLNAEQRSELTAREARAEATELRADIVLVTGYALSFTLFALAWRRTRRLASDREDDSRLLAERALELDIANRHLQQLLLSAAARLDTPARQLQALQGRIEPDRAELSQVTRAVTDLVGDLRTFAQLVGYVPRRERVELTPIVRRILKRLALTLGDTGAHLDVAPLPVVLGDPLLIEHALFQLLENALSYPRTGVPLAVQVTTAPANDGFITLQVRDNGVGIVRDNHARAFSLFERIGRTDAEGHGIGLPIAQRAAELMGSQVRIESAPGVGSVLSLTMQVAR